MCFNFFVSHPFRVVVGLVTLCGLITIPFLAYYRRVGQEFALMTVSMIIFAFANIAIALAQYAYVVYIGKFCQIVIKL